MLKASQTGGTNAALYNTGICPLNCPLISTLQEHFLLDFNEIFQQPVAADTPPSTVALHQLQLDDARALLERDTGTALPSPTADPAAYLQGVIDGLCELSLKDPLTGLANRRHFRAMQERTIDGVARSGEPASAVNAGHRPLQKGQ